MVCTLAKAKSALHRTQIYLQDDLHDSPKVRARSLFVSISELIRRRLKKDIQKDPVADARAYFTWPKPLESFANVDSECYVSAIRTKSRILQTAPDARCPRIWC